MRIRPYRTVSNLISGVVITFNNISEQKRQHDHLQLLMSELQHRTNNIFTVINAMARQIVRRSASLADFEEQFGARVQALARSNALLIEQEWKGVPLHKLIETQLSPFIGIDKMRIEMVGSPVTMAAGNIQALGLALHELATNASKYGALSAPGGKILVSWDFDDGTGAPDSFWIEWREQGGPPVKPATRKGFGNFVTDQMVTRALSATVEVDLAPDGLRWRARMPQARLAEDNSRAPARD
jgi:two-component system, chemotaxis family, CheB/CheR fusion protein